MLEIALQAGGDKLSATALFALLDEADSESRCYLYAIAALRFLTNAEDRVAQLAAVLSRPTNAHVQAFVLAAARGVELALMRQQLSAGTPEAMGPFLKNWHSKPRVRTGKPPGRYWIICWRDILSASR